jgi:RNA polymerase sigma-70 factor (ECF subfamily)
MPISLPSSSDQEFVELLAKARRGDADAIGELINRYRPYLLKIASDEADADLRAKDGDSDVVQDACTQAFKVFGKFAGRTGEEMRAWLRCILLRQLGDVRDRYRSHKRDIRAEVPLQDMVNQDSGNGQLAASISTPSEQVVHQEERDLVETALAALDPEDREIIKLRQKDGQPFADIARKLRISEDAAEKRWWRAIQNLREKVRRLYGRPNA